MEVIPPVNLCLWSNETVSMLSRIGYGPLRTVRSRYEERLARIEAQGLDGRRRSEVAGEQEDEFAETEGDGEDEGLENAPVAA